MKFKIILIIALIVLLIGNVSSESNDDRYKRLFMSLNNMTPEQIEQENISKEGIRRLNNDLIRHNGNITSLENELEEKREQEAKEQNKLTPEKAQDVLLVVGFLILAIAVIVICYRATTKGAFGFSNDI